MESFELIPRLNLPRVPALLASVLILTTLAASARASDPAPRLVRIALGPSLPLERVLAAGLDVVEVRRGREVRVLEWPGDEALIAALGANAELIDATPGTTLARRAAADPAARPWRARPANATATAVLPPFGSGSMGGYWTGDEIKLKLDQLVANDVNDVVSDKIDTLGLSYQGRPIWGLKLGKTVVGEDTRPAVFYNALTHAREPEGMQALFYFVDDLLSKYGTDAFATSLLDHRVIYIVPLVNPDGYQINVNTYNSSRGTTFGFQRKNAHEVDLNRNYGFKWGVDNVGSSPAPLAETYRGNGPFSEPETQVQRDVVKALKPKTGLSFHTYSDLMLFPWGYTTIHTLDDDAFREWTDAASLGDGYQTGQAIPVLYAVNGEFNDWTYGDTLAKPRAFTWTPEVGNPNDDFYPPPSRIVPLAVENLRRCYFTAAIAGSFVRIESASFAGGSLGIGALQSLAVRARNLGLATAGPLLQARLISLDPGVEVFDGGPISYPGLGSRKSGDALGGAAFTVGTADTLTPGRMLRLEVDFSDADGSFSRDTVEIAAGVPTVAFADDGASLAAWSSVGGWGLAAGDALHATPYFADSPGGFYSANTNRTLTLSSTLDFSAGVHAYAMFGSRWDIETGFDAAMLEASFDGVTWTPLPGRGTALGVPSSQPVGVPIYEGTRHRWAGERVDLSSFAGPSAGAVHLRWRLTSDVGTEFDGFNFDTLRIVTFDPAAQPPPLSVRNRDPMPVSTLAPPTPNPVTRTASFTFFLPRDGAAELEILDLSGRRVRVLSEGRLPAARYVRTWDLRDDGGLRVPPGLYFARLRNTGRSITRRLAVLQ